MQYVLRDYQNKAVEAAMKHFDNYNKPFVLVLPTGAGKSLVVADICHKLDQPVLILQPTKEILEQNYNKLLSYGIEDISIYSASFNSKEISKYTYATIGSIYKKPELFKQFKYVLLDECSGLNPKNLDGMYNQFFREIGCEHICGLTASPYRLVQKYYNDGDGLVYTAYLQTINRIYPFYFKKFAYQVSIKNLLGAGYLAKLDYKFYDDFDVSGIKINTTGADFDEKSLEKFWNDKRLKKLSDIILEIDKTCKHNLIFCSSIRQAEKCKEMLTAYGLSTDIVTSKTNAKGRDSKITAFRSGKIKHMINVGVLTYGFDFPELDSITLARATISLTLYYQMVGRGMRPHPDKQSCQIIDITDNVKRMGRVETIELAKEEGGFRDIVITEVGEITNKPLFKFRMRDQNKINQILKNTGT